MTGAADLQALLAAARAARDHAYAPYSGYRVGAAILGGDGSVYVGGNVENAAYPLSQCAEASAIGAMIAGGCRTIAEILIVAEGGDLVVPCGGCRQLLAEFAGPQTPVHMADRQGVAETVTLGTLLPRAFGPGQLKA